MTFTNYDDLIGQKFGRLTIISETEPRLQPNGKKVRQCICDCDCGAKGFVVPFIYLTRGVNKSCGCLIKERNKRGADKREIVKNRKVERHERRLKREAEIKRIAEEKRCARRIKKEQKEAEKQRKRELAHGNKYEFHANYVIGYTHNNNTPFYIDVEDYEKVKPFTWYDRNTNGVKTIATNIKIDGKTHSVVMHVFLGYKYHDHINNNELDNRKANLRPCTHHQNMFNKKIQKDNKYGISGIGYIQKTNKWIAKIGYQYKNIRLGIFDTKEEAIVARLKAEKEYFGEFAPQKQLFSQYGIE